MGNREEKTPDKTWVFMEFTNMQAALNQSPWEANTNEIGGTWAGCRTGSVEKKDLTWHPEGTARGRSLT